MEPAMAAQIGSGKRNLLKIAAFAGATFTGGLIVPSAIAAKRKKESEKKAEVTPPEDLMREHGVVDLLKGLVSAHEYDAMAEDFEKKEHQLLAATASR
jgi:hypothetical protein